MQAFCFLSIDRVAPYLVQVCSANYATNAVKLAPLKWAGFTPYEHRSKRWQTQLR